MPKRKAADFVHLHSHTQYSLLDGASRISGIVELAAEFGMPAVAITDHGNLFGAIEFYKAAQQAGVKPIVGAEVYIAPTDRRERKIHAEIPESSFHLTLLCRDETGYRNLMKLVSLGYLEGFYYRPRIDKELLAQHAEGLIGLSGCLKGEVNYFLRRGDNERAMSAAARYQEILGPGSFYLEVMRSGIDEQERIIPGILELTAALGLQAVATNDCHYLRPDDAKAHDVLVCIQTGKRLTETDRLRVGSDQLHFRSPAEMAKVFADMPDAVRQSREIADKCNLLLDFDRVRFHLPRYESPEGFKDDFTYLCHLANEGLKRRYHRMTPALEGRLKHELDVIREMGFPGYFLVVKDIVDFARSSGIPVGPGRGSAAGCLVLYCLGITDIDPLRHGLLFERFLSLERVSLPDVDIDFSDTKRQQVIDYIRARYGDDSVAQTITFGTMQARAVVRDVGRVLDVPILEVDRLAKLIAPGKKLDDALADSPELTQTVNSKPEYKELIAIARKLEGLNRHASIHASAVVIAPQPLIELVPLYKSTEGDICTQFDMYSLDAVGLLKMDVLGLRTLTVVEEAARLTRGSDHRFEVESLDPDDTRTYQMLQRGDTVGVFQLESAGMRDLCRKMLPESIEHVIALIALYRPGPMELVPNYLARKAGTEAIEYEHSLLEPICRETYGVLIYQEQVMQAAQALAGYTLGKADLLRRAMGKKNPEEMEAQRETFVEGCWTHNRIPHEKAERIFNLLAKFAGYGFNKSHAAGYAGLSYITAYLKANFPVEFIAANLTSELGDFKELAKFAAEARRTGIEVLGPDVNRSESAFTIEDGRVRFGLAGIKNLGQGASEQIVRERSEHGPYENLLDFLVRNRRTANRKAVESMVKAGAFDCFDQNRTRLLSGLDLELAKAGSDRLRYQELQTDLFPADAEDRPAVDAKAACQFDTHHLLKYEKDAFGFYFSSHPLEPRRFEFKALSLASIASLDDKEDGDAVALGGVVTARRSRRDKRDREYIIIALEDLEGQVEVMVFSDQLETCREHLMVDRLVIVQGKVRKREQGIPQIWADRVMPFDAASRYIKNAVVTIPPQLTDDMPLLKLRDALSESEGESTVHLSQARKGGRMRQTLLREYRVKLDSKLIGTIVSIFGPDALKLHGQLPPLTNGPGGNRTRHAGPNRPRPASSRQA